jgi:hypothetical protein
VARLPDKADKGTGFAADWQGQQAGWRSYNQLKQCFIKLPLY